MTPEQLEQWADMCTPNTETGSLNYLKFAKLIEAHTREECAKLVEQDLYPDDSQKPYTQHYNSCIKRLAEKIRSGT